MGYLIVTFFIVWWDKVGRDTCVVNWYGFHCVALTPWRRDFLYHYVHYASQGYKTPWGKSCIAVQRLFFLLKAKTMSNVLQSTCLIFWKHVWRIDPNLSGAHVSRVDLWHSSDRGDLSYWYLSHGDISCPDRVVSYASVCHRQACNMATFLIQTFAWGPLLTWRPVVSRFAYFYTNHIQSGRKWLDHLQNHRRSTNHNGGLQYVGQSQKAIIV